MMTRKKRKTRSRQVGFTDHLVAWGKRTLGDGGIEIAKSHCDKQAERCICRDIIEICAVLWLLK